MILQPLSYLFNEITRLGRIFSTGQRVCFIFNYDGLLSPDIENCSSDSKRLTKQISLLVSLKNINVGVISIQNLRVLHEEIGIPSLILAGNLGYEIEGADFSWKFPEIGLIRHKVAELYEKLRWELYCRPIEKTIINFGVLLRINIHSIEKSKHNKLINIIEDHLELNRSLEASYGSDVIKIHPRGKWNNGYAIEKIMNFIPRGEGPFPLLIYFGNQSSDEPAFKKANIYGYSVIISRELKRPTAAKFFLKGNSDLVKFLLWIKSANS